MSISSLGDRLALARRRVGELINAAAEDSRKIEELLNNGEPAALEEAQQLLTLQDQRLEAIDYAIEARDVLQREYSRLTN